MCTFNLERWHVGSQDLVTWTGVVAYRRSEKATIKSRSKGKKDREDPENYQSPRKSE
jgi:hypothetical protein